MLKYLNTNLLIQEIIAGNERNILCSFAILDNSSNPLEIGHCRKIRQSPKHFGNTALAEPIIDDELEELSLSIFKALKLKGYASIEYKKDPRDEKLKILEITPNRFNRQFAVTNLKGLNLPYALYNFELGIKHKSSKIISAKAKWVSEVNELRSIRSYIFSKEYSLTKWAKELKNVQWFEIFDRKDIKPFIILLSKSIKITFIKLFYMLKNYLNKIRPKKFDEIEKMGNT